MHGLDAIFGLGQAESVEAVEVIWADGQRTRIENAKAGDVVIRR